MQKHGPSSPPLSLSLSISLSLSPSLALCHSFSLSSHSIFFFFSHAIIQNRTEAFTSPCEQRHGQFLYKETKFWNENFTFLMIPSYITLRLLKKKLAHYTFHCVACFCCKRARRCTVMTRTTINNERIVAHIYLNEMKNLCMYRLTRLRYMLVRV